MNLNKPNGSGCGDHHNNNNNNNNNNSIAFNSHSSEIKDLPLLILAGGRATRLKHLSQNLPKYLMPIENNKVFADIHLEWAHKQGFREVIISVGYLGSMVKEHCGDGTKWGLHIKYVEDGIHPLGTGGAVKKFLNSTKNTYSTLSSVSTLSTPSSSYTSDDSSIKHKGQINFSNLAITYGDTILNFSAADCLNRYLDSKVLGIMTFYKNEVDGHVCNINPIKNGLIYYNKIEPDSDWKYIDYGFSILSRTLIESFSDKIPLDLAEPLMKSSKAGQLAGYECKERFWEIGSLESLSEFRTKS